MVLVLTNLLPNLSDSNTATSGKAHAKAKLSDEEVNLLITALSALVDAADVFPRVIKTDLHACILHVFATILATPACQASVVPRALPILKKFLGSVAAFGISAKSKGATNGEGDASTQLRATLYRFLAILKHAQAREFDAALACEKNAILATTVLVSTSTSLFAPNELLLRTMVDKLYDCLGARMTSKVAAGCVRSLLLLPKKTGGEMENALAALLLPRILSFLANPMDVEGLEESRSLLSQALVSFVSTLPEGEKRVLGAKIVVPALLERARKEEGVTGETAARLLELAGADGAAFRSVVSGLSAEQRSFMEGILRSGSAGAGRRNEKETEEGGEPRIALKMDFGI